MTPYERRILEAFADTILPPTDRLPDKPTDIGLTDRVTEHLRYHSKNLRRAFRWVLVCLEIVGLFWGARFTRMTPGGQERYLERWRNSPVYWIRLLYQLVLSTCLINYYSHPSVYRRLGYEPPVSRRPSSVLKLQGVPEDLFLKTDVCVIGSGAGGAVVAKELAEKGRSVVVLEEGGYFNTDDFGREAVEVVRRVYHGGGVQATFGLPVVVLPTGRAVGGTTVINSGTCFRLPDKVLNRWQSEYGLNDLTPEALAPYFDRVEHHLNVVPVTDEILGGSGRLFREGLERMGLKGGPLLRNVKDCKGSGMCCFGCPTEAKQAMHLTYLPQAVLKGAKVFAHCRVEQIFPRLEHGGEVVGVFIDPATGARKRTIRVDAKVVILAAGTLQTPYLLRKNHIEIFNHHIGRHMTIHPTGKVIAFFDQEVRGWEGVPQSYLFDGMADEGIMFEGAFVPPSFGSFHLDLAPRLHKEKMAQYSQMAVFGFLISDEGRGWIRWLPNGDPIAYYSIKRREVTKYLKGIRFLCEVYLKAGAKWIYTSLKACPVVTPETGLRPLEHLKIHRTDLEVSAYHPLGTCRMGVDPDTSVVNGWGEMHYVRNLFIADGSIFPTSLGVNPQETIMAFANRTADYIDAKRL